jgi:hypothetical protein
LTIVAALLIVLAAVALGIFIGVNGLLNELAKVDPENTAKLAIGLAKRFRSKAWMKWPPSKP